MKFIIPAEQKEKFKSFIIRNKKDKFFRKMFNSYEEALENYKGILKHNIHKDNFILEGYSKITGMQTIHYIPL